MKKAKSLLIIIVSLLSVGLIGWAIFYGSGDNPRKSYQSITSSEPTPSPNNTQQNVTLLIESENDLFTFNSESEDLTAYDLLQSATESGELVFEVEEYDIGVIVSSINGLENSADMAWIYFVNGESATVAADQYELESGDVVEWKYLTSSDN